MPMWRPPERSNGRSHVLFQSHPLSQTEPPYPAADEDTLLQGLNSYRQSSGVTALSKNDKAGCLAEKITDTNSQIRDYPKLIYECKIDINTTRDSTILPVCVPKLVPTLVLTNYTRTKYASYVNDSKYTSAGFASEDDWMVVVLTTNTPTGSFLSGARSGFKVGLGPFLVYLLGVLPVMLI